MSGIGLIAIQIGIMFAMLFIVLGAHFAMLNGRIQEILSNQEIIIAMLNGTGVQ